MPARRVYCHLNLRTPWELGSQKQVRFTHRSERFQNQPLNLVEHRRLRGAASCPTPSRLGSRQNLDLLGLAQVVSQRPRPKEKQPEKQAKQGLNLIFIIDAAVVRLSLEMFRLERETSV